MAINTVAAPQQLASNRLYDMLNSGIAQGVKTSDAREQQAATSQDQANAQQAASDLQKQSAQSQLSNMLTEKQAESSNAATTRDSNVAAARGIVDDYSGRGQKVNAKFGTGGAVDISHSEDNPYAKMLSGQNHVIGAAQADYMKGYKDIQSRANIATGALDAINDPKNPGSLGTVQAMMVQGTGNKRFNEHEAQALFPPSTANAYNMLMNKIGGDTNSPLSHDQQAAANTFFTHLHDQAGADHDTLRRNAAAGIEASPMGGKAAASQWMSTVGKPFDEQRDMYKKKYGQLPQTAQGSQDRATPITPTPPMSLMDRLQGMNPFKGSPAGQQAPQAAPQSASAHPQDSAAMQWAKSNPNDPRASAILKANGG